MSDDLEGENNKTKAVMERKPEQKAGKVKLFVFRNNGGRVQY